MKEFLESANLLETVAAEGRKNSAEADELVSGLSEEQLNWTSHPDKWSIAQCLEHLATTSQKFEQYYSKAIARGRDKHPATGAVAYRPTLMGGWLAGFVDPKSAKKFPAPKAFRPSQSAVKDSLKNFLQRQESFLDFVRQSKGIDYNKTRLRSPVTPLMRYSLADAFVVTVLHGRRHLAQARRVKEAPGFPA